MNEYVAVYKALELPEAALEVFAGDVPLPIYATAPPLNYGFPPALIPMWSRDNPSYVGYWKHWFSPRTGTFVRMYIDGGRRVAEIARTFDQVVRTVILESVTEDEGVEPQTRSFASRVGVSDAELDRIDQISADTGDELPGLLTLDVFERLPPKLIVDEAGGEYDGEFPVESRPASYPRSCDLELPPEFRVSAEASENAPPWYGARDQRPVFQDLLGRENFEGAWLSLNSSGWDFAEAKEAARALRDRAQAAGRSEPGFEAVIEAWLAQPHENAGTF